MCQTPQLLHSTFLYEGPAFQNLILPLGPWRDLDYLILQPLWKTALHKKGQVIYLLITAKRHPVKLTYFGWAGQFPFFASSWNRPRWFIGTWGWKGVQHEVMTYSSAFFTWTNLVVTVPSCLLALWTISSRLVSKCASTYLQLEKTHSLLVTSNSYSKISIWNRA